VLASLSAANTISVSQPHDGTRSITREFFIYKSALCIFPHQHNHFRTYIRSNFHPNPYSALSQIFSSTKPKSLNPQTLHLTTILFKIYQIPTPNLLITSSSQLPSHLPNQHPLFSNFFPLTLPPLPYTHPPLTPTLQTQPPPFPNKTPPLPQISTHLQNPPSLTPNFPPKPPPSKPPTPLPPPHPYYPPPLHPFTSPYSHTPPLPPLQPINPPPQPKISKHPPPPLHPPLTP
jgi:hypothetical protein